MFLKSISNIAALVNRKITQTTKVRHIVSFSSSHLTLNIKIILQHVMDIKILDILHF